MMKAITLCTVFLCSATNLWPQQSKRDAAAIERVKAMLVSSLDPTLPRVSLQYFLAHEARSAPIQWEVNDCGEQTGNPAADAARDIPFCVEADIDLKDRRAVSLLIAVGTSQRGLQGRPALFSLVVIEEGGAVQSLRHLGELPAELQRPRPKKSPAAM